MSQICKRIVENDTFQSIIIFTLLVTAITIGLETIPAFEDQFGSLFYVLYIITQIIFVLEITIRILSYLPKPQKFFKGFWNNFDFTITVLSLLPIGLSFITVARLLRLIRVLRVVSASARLRSFLSKMHRSLDELFFASMVILVLIYIFSVSGFYLFSEISPDHWGSLSKAVVTTFYLILLQDLPRFIDPLIQDSELHLLFFMILYGALFSFFTCVIGLISAEYNQKDAHD